MASEHLPAAVIGVPALLQKLPDIKTLLPQGGGDRKHSAVADGTAGRLDAMADLALIHRWPEGSLGSVVGGSDSLDLEEGPQAIGYLQQLLASAHRLGPWRSLAG
jgi:hypothetical protein